MIRTLALLAAIASPAPAPSASATPRPPFAPLANPTVPPDYTTAVNATNEVNLLYGIFAPYCAKDGGISRLSVGSPYPISVDCVKQRLSIGADLKVTRLGP